MTYLDVVLGLPLLWAVYRGFTKGLIISVATLAALILGVYAAIHFSPLLGVYLDKWFHPNPKQLVIFSFILTFLIVVALVRLLGWTLDRFMKAVSLGFLNRFLGVAFSLLKWAFILSVIISLIESTDRSSKLLTEQTKDESLMYRPLSKVAPFVFPYLKFDKLKEKFETPPPPVKTINN